MSYTGKNICIESGRYATAHGHLPRGFGNWLVEYRIINRLGDEHFCGREEFIGRWWSDVRLEATREMNRIRGNRRWQKGLIGEITVRA